MSDLICVQGKAQLSACAQEKLKLPFSWLLNFESTDPVTVTLSVE